VSGMYVCKSSLNFKHHIQLLSSRVRKLIFIFKNLRHIADQLVIRMVYQSLCQSILAYCITTWGNASKTTMLELERAQRAVLKVGFSKPFRYPTKDLFLLTEVLTVRQLFIVGTVLKQHSLIKYDPSLNVTKRLKHKVSFPTYQGTTSFSRRFFDYMGSFLYNKLNKELKIYSLSRFECKQKIVAFLLKLDYDATEQLVKISY
jgi:hypothetical protein